MWWFKWNPPTRSHAPGSASALGPHAFRRSLPDDDDPWRRRPDLGNAVWLAVLWTSLAPTLRIPRAALSRSRHPRPGTCLILKRAEQREGRGEGSLVPAPAPGATVRLARKLGARRASQARRASS